VIEGVQLGKQIFSIKSSFIASPNSSKSIAYMKAFNEARFFHNQGILTAPLLLLDSDNAHRVSMAIDGPDASHVDGNQEVQVGICQVNGVSLDPVAVSTLKSKLAALCDQMPYENLQAIYPVDCPNGILHAYDKKQCLSLEGVMLLRDNCLMLTTEHIERHAHTINCRILQPMDDMLDELLECDDIKRGKMCCLYLSPDFMRGLLHKNNEVVSSSLNKHGGTCIMLTCHCTLSIANLTLFDLLLH
jgi:hypothetical protein